MNDAKQEGLLCVSYMIGHLVNVTMCKSQCIFSAVYVLHVAYFIT